jgi:hypothetical protein
MLLFNDVAYSKLEEVLSIPAPPSPESDEMDLEEIPLSASVVTVLLPKVR